MAGGAESAGGRDIIEVGVTAGVEEVEDGAAAAVPASRV